MTMAQLEAVQSRGNVIVVAGAGTGKTTTLVDRVLALLEAGTSVERLLLVTFTDAAAAEMRHRLRVRLATTAAAATGETALRWQEQLALLDTARIGTLHSFCLQLIREHFHLLGIDPAAGILDEQQTQPLIKAALDECLAPHFVESDLIERSSRADPPTPDPSQEGNRISSAVREVIRRYAGGDPERIRGLILRLHRHAQTLPSPDQWFAEQLAALDNAEPAAWRAWLLAGVRQWAGEWLPELERNAGQAENLARCARALEAILDPPTPDPSQEGNRKKLVDVPLTPARSPSEGERECRADALAEILAADAAEWPKKMKGKLRGPVEKFFAEAEFFASQLEATTAGDGLAADWQNVRGSLTALLTLAREFGVRFAAAKREQGGMDFSDLEQFALRLLWDAHGQPTPVAQACRELFAQVFVDECQDINAAQDAIIRAVSLEQAESGNSELGTANPEPRTSNLEPEKTGANRKSEIVNRKSPTPAPDPSQEGNQREAAGNRFLVGDVKQSIYQFRLARPKLFRDYEEAWRPGVNGRRISLVDNFRSHPEVIAFVNEFFAPLMRESVGGVAYEALNAGRVEGAQGPAEAGTPTADRRVEFHLIPKRDAAEAANDREGTDETEAVAEDAGDLLAVEREARVVALRLRELKESGHTIWDKEAKAARPVEWRDMAVLLRSPRSRVEAFAKEFHRCGVPLQAERGGFLESTEVSDLLSLVRLLDNPLQDIPLLAVLRSPLVAMSLDELAQVRIASDARRLWVALREFVMKSGASPDRQDACATAETARRKVDQFLNQYAHWRELARQASLSHCLETTLADTHYEAVTQAGERGAERVANVRKFVALVRQYDPYQRQGLFRFLRFIEALQAAEQDIEPAPAPAQDAVRLMSIHKSKGLEFPVVAVACLGTQFNLGDQRADVLVDEEFGLCAKAVAASGAKHPTLAHWLAARRQRRQLQGEELRLLYVAMTRARDRLILTGTPRRQNADEWEADAGREFDDRAILKAQSALDWVLLWLPRVMRVEDLGPEDGANELFRWRLRREEPVLPSLIPERAGSETGAPDAAALLAEVTRRIRWRYPQATAVDEPAKTTVTALRRKSAEQDEDASPWRFVAGEHRLEAHATAGGLDAAAVGTLHHEFLQMMTLTGAGDEADVRGQLAALVAAGGLGAEEAVLLDVAALAAFWSGEVGAKIRANARAVRRELPFTARFTPLELEQITGTRALPGLRDEFVVVQGVADLAVLLPAEIWLLDFKTDDVSGQALMERAGKYRPQLALYAAALAGIYQRPVTQRWLHFIRARRTVEV